MQNETTNYKLQQNGDEQSIDIKQLIYICLNHWYLFVICVIVALAIGFVVNRYTKNVYQTSGTVLIKSDQSFDPTALMTNLNTGKSNVENEMAILRSYSLVERTIKKMNLEVTYMEKGRINTFELYKAAPFDVDFDRSVPQTVGLVYEVSIQKDGKIILHGTSDNLIKYDYVLGQTVESTPNKVDITSECKQGEWLDNGYNRIRIVFNDKYNAETDNSRKLYFRLNSYASLVKQMMRYSVNTTSKQSSVVAIVMSGNNPRKIVEFTNTLMNEYVMRGLEQKNQVSDNTILFIDSELAGIEESLATAASELKEFRTQNDLMNLDQQSSQIYSKIQALEREKAEMTVNVKIYMRLQDYIKGQIDDPENLAAPSTMGITDPLLNRLVTELVTLSQTKATQLLTQTEQHPQIVKLDEQIVTTKRTLLETINNLVSNAELSLEEINKRIGKAMSESKVLPEKQQQLINYQRNFNFNDDTYKYLMQRRAEAQILKASNTPDNEVLDEARIERTSRISPRTSMNYLIALILGLLVPALYLFLKDFFNVTISDRKDVEKLTSFPIIGQVAQTSSKDPLVVVNSPKSPIAESFRSIRTNVEFITQGKSQSTILVTGDMQSIGKTFNAINVASIYALYGKKTVLLGFDLRKPKLFKEFGLNNNIGLSSFLSNKEPFDSIIQSTTAIPSLDVITSGPIPPNPAELIASEKCDELFKLLRERYEYIIIDTPPVGLVTDAFLLMRHSDVNLFIVRQGVTNKNIFGTIIKDMEARDLKMSIVINGIQTSKGYGYSYGKYRYGYGYAYGYGYGKYGSSNSGYYGNDYYGEGPEGGKDKRRHHSKDKDKSNK